MKQNLREKKQNEGSGFQKHNERVGCCAKNILELGNHSKALSHVTFKCHKKCYDLLIRTPKCDALADTANAEAAIDRKATVINLEAALEAKGRKSGAGSCRGKNEE